MSLPVPFSEDFPSPLDVDMRIRVKAAFKDNGKIFTFMLLCDKDYEMADALLIIETDGSPELKLSYRKDGVIGNPQVIPVDDLYTHKTLDLFISMDRDYFKITFNKQYTKNYPYNFSLKKVKNMWIDGDINLFSVFPQN